MVTRCSIAAGHRGAGPQGRSRELGLQVFSSAQFFAPLKSDSKASSLSLLSKLMNRCSMQLLFLKWHFLFLGALLDFGTVSTKSDQHK